MLKILDRFIIGKFLKTYFFMVGVIMLLAMVFDISEKLSEFIEKDAPISRIFVDYYLNFIIFYGNLFSPLITFVSVIWFTAKMAQNSEIIPMLYSGRPFTRIVRPYFIAATVLMLLSLTLNHIVLPMANKGRLDFEEEYYKNTKNVSDYHAEYPDNSVVYFRNYNGTTGKVLDFVVEKRDENQKLTYVLKAPVAYNTEGTNWTIENYVERYVGKLNDKIVTGTKKDTTLLYKSADMVNRESVAMTMGYEEIQAFIISEREKGSKSVPTYEIELHRRTSMPFATYVLTLIGLAVSSRKSRGGIGVNLAIGLLLAFLYIFAMKMTAVAAINVGMAPIIAVWIPNLIFAALGILLYRLAPK